MKQNKNKVVLHHPISRAFCSYNKQVQICWWYICPPAVALKGYHCSPSCHISSECHFSGPWCSCTELCGMLYNLFTLNVQFDAACLQINSLHFFLEQHKHTLQNNHLPFWKLYKPKCYSYHILSSCKVMLIVICSAL